MSLTPLARLLTDPRAGDSIVALRNGAPVTTAQFRHDAASAAAHFTGAAAALVCADSYLFAVGLWGLMHAGARVILPPGTQPAALQNLGACDFIVDDAAMQSISATPAILQPLDPDAPLIDVFTSGSTGAPQRVPKNLTGFDREIEILDRLWGSSLGTGATHATVSHQHIYGLTFKLLWPLASGRPFAAETPMLWEDVLASLTPDATLISSPGHLRRLQGIAPLPAGKRVSAIFSAGAPLPGSAAQDAQNILGATPNEIFGSTETGAIATRCLTTGPTWRVLPGIDIRVGDDGTLLLRTPFASNEWMTTKDRVEAAPDGFTFKGRADTIVKIEGKRVSLTAVEAMLTRLPEIAAAAPVMLEGEPPRLAAAVVLSPEGLNALARLGPFRLSRYLRHAFLAADDAASIPRLWRFVVALPDQAMGKRRAADIVALFEGPP